MILVDSSVWIAQLRGQDTGPVRTLKAIEDTDDILVGDLIMLEVLQGARDDRHAARIERNLREFTVARLLDEQVAVEAARNYRRLREAGVTVRKTIDMIIATFCMMTGQALLHDDRDFDLIAARLPLRLA